MNIDQFFSKEDNTNDNLFYSTPRLVKHIDDNACGALTRFYRNYLEPGSAVLDLMSSWVSHLPEDIQYSRVSAQGMNKEELEANPQVKDHVLQTHQLFYIMLLLKH